MEVVWSSPFEPWVKSNSILYSLQERWARGEKVLGYGKVEGEKLLF